MRSTASTSTRSGLAGVLLFFVLAAPLSRQILEGSLTMHMLVQIPLLVISGWLIGKTQRLSSDVRGSAAVRAFNRQGVTGIVLFACVALLWMIPRLLEQSLAEPGAMIAKFVSLPLAGIALAWSYPIAPPILIGVLLAHAVSMLAAMGWVYLTAPTRLCNAYLAEDQALAGMTLLGIAGTLALAIGWRTLFGAPRVAAAAHR